MQQKKMQGVKALNKTAMKNVKGGAAPAATIWVCVIDGADCYSNLSLCRAGCSRPNSCRAFSYCP